MPTYTWRVDAQTHICVDYVIDGSFPSDPNHLSVTAAVILQPGEEVWWYRYNGSTIVKRALIEYNPKKAAMRNWQARVDAIPLMGPEVKQLLKDGLEALGNEFWGQE